MSTITEATVTDRARRWMHVQIDRSPRVAGAFAAWLATPAGGWGETRQAWHQFTDLMPVWPHDGGYRVWKSLTEADLLAVATERGIHMHASRRD